MLNMIKVGVMIF